MNNIILFKMYRIIKTLLLTLVLNVILKTYGYKWVQVPRGHPLPNHSVSLSEDRNYHYSSYSYVGRARHFGEILPAKVYNSSVASIYSCSKTIFKSHFEVLVAQEPCEWQRYTSVIPENVVYIGHYQDNEPIYGARGRGDYYNSETEIASLLLKPPRIVSKNSNDYDILTCNDDKDWIDVAATAVPNNTISGGLSHNNHSIFVARLKHGCDIVPAQVIPELGVATNEQENIESIYCQVLVGDPDDYVWQIAENGSIPDYAVVGGKSDMELQYIARVNKTLGYLTFSLALEEGEPYEILVKNENKSEESHITDFEI